MGILTLHGYLSTVNDKVLPIIFKYSLMLPLTACKEKKQGFCQYMISFNESLYLKNTKTWPIS